MDVDMSTHAALPFASWFLLQLLNAPQALYLPEPTQEEDDEIDTLQAMVFEAGQPLFDPLADYRTSELVHLDQLVH